MVGREVLPVSLLRQNGRLLNFDARFWENNISLSPIYFASQVFSILLYRGACVRAFPFVHKRIIYLCSSAINFKYPQTFF